MNIEKIKEHIDDVLKETNFTFLGEKDVEEKVVRRKVAEQYMFELY